jgi:hypothetical protein
LNYPITQAETDVNSMIVKLREIFGYSGSKVELFNDLDGHNVYSINTYYSMGKTTMKRLKQIKAKITFIDFDKDGLRVLVEVKN